MSTAGAGVPAGRAWAGALKVELVGRWVFSVRGLSVRRGKVRGGIGQWRGGIGQVASGTELADLALKVTRGQAPGWQPTGDEGRGCWDATGPGCPVREEAVCQVGNGPGWVNGSGPVGKKRISVFLYPFFYEHKSQNKIQKNS